MADPLRHRQTKGAATDMVDLTPPRHIPTLLQLGRFRRVLRTAGVAHEHQFLPPRLSGRYRFRKRPLYCQRKDRLRRLLRRVLRRQIDG